LEEIKAEGRIFRRDARRLGGAEVRQITKTETEAQRVSKSSFQKTSPKAGMMDLRRREL